MLGLAGNFYKVVFGATPAECTGEEEIPTINTLACSAGVFVRARDRKFAAMLAWVKWVGASPFSLTPNPSDVFLSFPKPLPSLNPRWR